MTRALGTAAFEGEHFLTVHEMGPLRVPLNRRHTSSEKKRILDDAFWLEKKVSKTSRQMARNALFTKNRKNKFASSHYPNESIWKRKKQTIH